MPSGLLIIGIGNEARGDDAVGLVVVRSLLARLPHVRTAESSGEPAGLMQLWSTAQSVHVIDAVQAGGKAGRVYRIDVIREDLPAVFSRGSTHILGFGEAVELARALNMLPPEMVFWGVEAQSFEPGAEMSPTIRKAGEQVIGMIEAECRAEPG